MWPGRAGSVYSQGLGAMFYTRNLIRAHYSPMIVVARLKSAGLVNRKMGEEKEAPMVD